MDRDQTADRRLPDGNRMDLTQLDYLQHLLNRKAYAALADANEEKSACTGTHCCLSR
jgi:hypothetical protein